MCTAPIEGRKEGMMIICSQEAGVGTAEQVKETHTESPPQPGPWKCRSGSRWEDVS